MRWMLLVTVLCSFSAWSHPIILKIKNPRANSLFLISKTHGQKIEIPAHGEREVVLLAPDASVPQDWELAYATGFGGAFTWTVQLKIEDLVGRLRQAAGEHWADDVLKIARVELVEDEGMKKFALSQELTGVGASAFLSAVEKLTKRTASILLPIAECTLSELLVPTREPPAPNNTGANANLPSEAGINAFLGCNQASF